MTPTKAELEERISSLEDALEEAQDLISEVLGEEDTQEDGEN